MENLRGKFQLNWLKVGPFWNLVQAVANRRLPKSYGGQILWLEAIRREFVISKFWSGGLTLSEEAADSNWRRNWTLTRTDSEWEWRRSRTFSDWRWAGEFLEWLLGGTPIRTSTRRRTGGSAERMWNRSWRGICRRAVGGFNHWSSEVDGNSNWRSSLECIGVEMEVTPGGCQGTRRKFY